MGGRNHSTFTVLTVVVAANTIIVGALRLTDQKLVVARALETGSQTYTPQHPRPSSDVKALKAETSSVKLFKLFPDAAKLNQPISVCTCVCVYVRRAS